MGAQPPFKPAASFNTPLSPADELAFRTWVANNKVPFNSNAGAGDYDMRGYYQGVMNGNPMARPTAIDPNDNRPHFTDYYKTPQHETFSSDSQWADPTTPSWINDSQLVAPNGRVVFDDKQQPAPSDSIQSIVNLMMGRR